MVVVLIRLMDFNVIAHLDILAIVVKQILTIASQTHVFVENVLMELTLLPVFALLVIMDQGVRII